MYYKHIIYLLQRAEKCIEFQKFSTPGAGLVRAFALNIKTEIASDAYSSDDNYYYGAAAAAVQPGICAMSVRRTESI